MHSITASPTHACYGFSFFWISTVQDVQMNFQTPNLLYPKFLVAFLPRKMCELSSFSSVLKMFFCLGCISADDTQHLIHSHHSRMQQFLVSSHYKSPPQKAKGLALQRTHQIGTQLQSFWHAHLYFLCNIYLGRYLETLLSGPWMYLNRAISQPRAKMTYANTGLSFYFVLFFKDAISFGIYSTEVVNTSVRAS